MQGHHLVCGTAGPGTGLSQFPGWCPVHPAPLVAPGGFKVALDTHGENPERAGVTRVEQCGPARQWPPKTTCQESSLLSSSSIQGARLAPGNICFFFSVTGL